MSFGWTDGRLWYVFRWLEVQLEAARQCILAKIGSAIAWIFTPLGWTQCR